jgi:DNA-directed RNA polymerase specialized sigma24 family protein
MGKATSDARNFWTGLIALLLVGLVLAVRTERGVSMVTATRPDAPIAKDAEAASQRALLADLDAKAARVRAAIAELPPKQRATLVLRMYQELSHQEIATILGGTVGAAKANLFHALQNLKRLLERPNGSADRQAGTK